MTYNLGGTTSVYRITKQSTEELAESDVIAELENADRAIRAETSRRYVLDKQVATFIRQNGTVSQSYETYFEIKSGEVPTVYVNNVLQVEDTDYTYSDSVITFTGRSLLSRDVIQIYYIPSFFDDYANYLAAENLYSIGLIDTMNSTGKASYDSVGTKLNYYRRLLSSKPHVAGARDHRNNSGIF